MTRTIAVIALLLFLAATHAGDATAKAEIQALYDQIGKSLEKKDIEGITRFSLPTATLKYADGTELTLADWKARAVKGFPAIKSIKARFTIDTVKLTADGAEATYSENHDMVVADPKDGKDKSLQYRSRWSVILKKTSDGWRTSRSVELERQVKAAD